MHVACAACVACAAHIAHAACVARAGRAGASKTFNNKSKGRVEIQTTRNMPARGMLDGGAGDFCGCKDSRSGLSVTCVSKPPSVSVYLFFARLFVGVQFRTGRRTGSWRAGGWRQLAG